MDSTIRDRPTRVAIAGATGRIGTLTRLLLEEAGHEVVPLSRHHGVNLVTGAGLDDALNGVGAVIDVTNSTSRDRSETTGFFRAVSANLLTRGLHAGVGHHVVLSIAGVDRVNGNAHYAGKRAQEAAVEAGQVPYTIVPATQFHDFAEMVASWSEADGVARVPPLLVQPIAPRDVAAILTRVATGPAQGRHVDVAGPDPHDLVDMARRTHEARGRSVRLVPTWDDGVFDATMAGNVLLPAHDVEIAPTSFDEWLGSQREARPHGRSS